MLSTDYLPGNEAEADQLGRSNNRKSLPLSIFELSQNSFHATAGGLDEKEDDQNCHQSCTDKHVRGRSAKVWMKI